jgi:RNA polymerase sigma factor (TIGR02999 family)
MPDRQATRDITTLLQAWRQGDTAALDRLLPIAYDELRRLARARLRHERPDHTLEPTALVHEAYVRLIGKRVETPGNRMHFFALAAHLMRDVLVDHARRRAAQKRGRSAVVIPLDESIPAPGSETIDLLTLDEALTELDALEPRLCRVVELRFFAGLSIAETARALDVSTATVERDWVVARTWLHQRLSS